ncbi:MAG: hypothetical protein CBC13_06580 [Planctomycetia bacterium TMED53]|nr:MAG: hypothetical protein CBC13_06580 [Planctomycetia bacterium TMED53]
MLRFFIALLIGVYLSGCGGSSDTGVQIEAIPPQLVEYPTLGLFFLDREIVPVQPHTIGGNPTSWTISPPLPLGITLDSETGVISGTPQQVYPEAPHMILASNEKGTVAVTVVINVLSSAPCDLTYGDQSLTIYSGLPIEPLIPLYGCGSVDQWSVVPDLPAGLSFDSVSGIISGTPTELSGQNTFLISAANPFGSTSFALEIQVADQAPCDLVYSQLDWIFPYGEEILPIDSTNSCGMALEYEVSPSLPLGLSLDTESGQISGTPILQQAQTPYVITARNLTGETSVTLQIEVTVEAPCDLVYPQGELVLNQGDSVPEGLQPDVGCGPVSSYSVSPALPEGVALDSVSGLISGASATSHPLTSHVIRAENSSGFSEFTILLEVLPEAPCELVYVPNTLILEEGISMGPATPQNECGVAVEYEIFPDLPAGLSLDTQTGVISGNPANPQVETLFSIVASNISGSAITQIVVVILPQPPCDLSYTDSVLQLTVGTPIPTMIPEIGCGESDGFSSLPPLPAGLHLDSTNGEISGIPEFIGGPTDHVIVAGNVAGNVSFQLSVEILEEPPCNLNYPQEEVDVVTGEVIGPIQPIVGCGQASVWTVSPEFPQGLILDPLTGIISGSVEEPYSLTVHQVVAANSSGSSVVDFSVTIKVQAPCNLDYGADSFQLLPGEPLGPLLPSSECGPVEEYSIDPPLPAGFSLDILSGELMGESQLDLPLTVYTISAHNGTGATDCVVQLGVTGVAPCNLTYPGQLIAASSGVDVGEQTPTFDCGQPSEWHITPALPEGLSFNELTGVISGAALQEGESTHLVTAGNQYGATQVEIDLVIREVYFYRGSEMVIPYSTSDGIGSSILTLYVEENSLNQNFPTDLSGLSMAIQYDSALLEFVSESQSEAMLNLNGGDGPDFWAVNPVEGGVLVGLLASFSFADHLTLPTETAIIDIEFATIPEVWAGDTEGLSGQLSWGNPTSIPLDNLVVIDGASSSLPLMEPIPFHIQPE